ncbi:hypothetical protein SAMN03097699_2842 [Flavobacteriaceae bacterium MAR_2010_188]|nr:hypothetical protein SAMN03097699_2842 [Flavobacteriaceae bacterium MAR_2010_188]
MKKFLLTSIMAFLTFAIYAQKPEVLEGDWEAISSIRIFDLEFDYSNVTIPEFASEEEYIAQKMKEKEEDEPGTGEDWKKRYFADREAHFEPKFIESFNKRGEWKADKTYDDSEYVMKVTTVEQYNGWNVGVMRKPARIAATIGVYKRNDNEPLLLVKYEDVKGADPLGYDFASHSRVAEGYAKLAKSFLRDLEKKG